MDNQQKILAVSAAAASALNSSEWKEISYLTDTVDFVDNHHRLLRSLNWGDSDYKEHVIDTIAHILQKNQANLKKLLEYEAIAEWFKKNNSKQYQALVADAASAVVEIPVPESSSSTAIAALSDAQLLLEHRGPSSAVDRVHTGFHGYLKGECSKIGINYAGDATANKLLKTLIDQHPTFKNLGPRGEDVKRIVQQSASIIDAIGTIRNQASLAHPNEELIDKDEALLVINVARSLLHFLDAKLREWEKTYIPF